MFGLRQYVNKKIASINNFVTNIGNSILNTSYKGSLFSMIIITIVWLSIFLYIAFYYAYMPSLIFNRPIHMQYKNCYSEKRLCDYPSAHIMLTKNNQILMVGQKYKMIVYINLPESPVNENIGMFMLCLRLSDKKGYLLSSSCRSTRLKYISKLYRIIHTIFMIPFYLTGISSEQQVLQLEMYTDFEDDKLHPVTDIYVEILNHDIQLYSANINIIANLTGLRYLMFHYPMFSAILGMGSNVFFVFCIFGMSWKHIYGSEVYKNESKILSDQREIKFEN